MPCHPNGKWIAYNSSRNGHAQVYRKPADGSGAEELLINDEEVVRPTDWSQDGKYLKSRKRNPSLERLTKPPPLQLRLLCLGWLKDGDIGFGVFSLP